MTVRTLRAGGLAVETWRATRRGREPVPLVRDASLDLRTGEVLALVGASGSGKSLACAALLDTLPPGTRRTGGRILLDGAETEPAALRGRAVASVLQAPRTAFNPLRTIDDHAGETLAVAGLRGGAGRAAMREALAAVGLGDDPRVPGLYPFQMSGGMLQRAMIALALLSRAPFLVADEPTTDLDLVAQARILDLLADLVRERSLGLLIVTHDLGVVARLADRVAVMAEGRIVETGAAKSIFARPSEPATQALLAAHQALHEVAPDGPPAVTDLLP
ncbi:ATP-binding cassette domain-containing protein [Methylobacterium frigidaeris]|uniref:Nickel import ATP-binding protein NikD n=1 Tax=Methylobacterium frigidaeris TaxID=2038277 RepID=A0AA37HGZ4_9HYPH|nr:ATP-binding cassette domain-containing protein [Methylobacterium frigidaeris]PIK72651.1 nickel import ATP-binding protein NikD [Methylobacterium frigidaeris]GJD65866.1 Nickel import ATP-binding protein NikD [Methylobacterium frigidaeris]